MCNCNKRRTYEAVTSVNMPPPADAVETAKASAGNAVGNANSE